MGGYFLNERKEIRARLAKGQEVVVQDIEGADVLLIGTENGFGRLPYPTDKNIMIEFNALSGCTTLPLNLPFKKGEVVPVSKDQFNQFKIGDKVACVPALRTLIQKI